MAWRVSGYFDLRRAVLFNRGAAKAEPANQPGVSLIPFFLPFSVWSDQILRDKNS